MSRAALPLFARGLSIVDAARYLGIRETKFRELVQRGEVASPRMIDSKKVWDVRELDAFFESLPRADDAANDDWGGAAA